MVLGRLGRGAKFVGRRARPSGKVGLAAVVIVSIGLAFGAAIALDLDPLGSLAVLTALLAGDTLITGVVLAGAGVVGAVGLMFSRFVGASRKFTAALGAGGAAAGGAATASVAGAAGAFTGSSLLAVGGSVLIALVVDHPVFTVIVGAAGIFFLTDPLASRGGFLDSLSFAIKLAVAALVAYLSVTLVGPDVRALVSVLPVVYVGGRGGGGGDHA